MEFFGLADIGWPPHSPRAGYVSDAAISGRPFIETREQGRWVSERSLRMYMDVMAVMAGDIMGRLKNWKGLAASIEGNFDQFFVYW